VTKKLWLALHRSRAGVKRTIAVRGSRSREPEKKDGGTIKKTHEMVMNEWKYQQQTGKLRLVRMQQQPVRPEL
jgi:hypothetical protein